MKRDYIYIAIILLALGAGIFGTVKYGKENRELRKDNKEYQKQVNRLSQERDSLNAEITTRNVFIKELSEAVDSTTSDLKKIHGKGIVTSFPRLTAIDTLDYGKQIKLLSGFISAADSLSR